MKLWGTSFSGALRAACSLGLILLFNSSCDSQNVYNSQSQQEDTDDTAARIAELQPALGNYCGSLHMIQSDQDYQANLTLNLATQDVHSSTSQDPTSTVRLPMLGGSMTFPQLVNDKNSPYSDMPDLIQATGASGSIGFTTGDYNPLDKSINLPFTAAGSQAGTIYGSVVGTLNGNTFTAQLFTQSSQLLGTFSFTKCAATGGNSS
jgi:hypothetical protein